MPFSKPAFDAGLSFSPLTAVELVFGGDAGHATRVVLREAHAIDSRFEEAFSGLRQSALTRFATRFRKFQEEGLASRSLDAELAAHFQLGVLDELLNWCVLSEAHLDIGTLASQFADFEWNGIRPDREG